MRIEWYGHSAFRLVGEGARVFIDPLGDTSAFVSHDLRIDYPPIAGVVADLLLVTHEHADTTASRRSVATRCCFAPRPGRSTPRSERSWPSPPSTTRAPAQSAGPTRSSPSPSTASASRTSATSARRRCGRSRPRRSEPSTSVRTSRRPFHDRRAGGGCGRCAAWSALGRPDALRHAANQLPRAG